MAVGVAASATVSATIVPWRSRPGVAVAVADRGGGGRGGRGRRGRRGGGRRGRLRVVEHVTVTGEVADLVWPSESVATAL